MSQPNEKFPSALQAVLLVVALFLVESLIGAGLYDLHGLLGLSENELAALTTLLANGLVFVVVLHIKGLSYRELFHPGVSSPQATLLLLFLPIVMLVPALVAIVSVLMQALVYVLPMSAWEQSAFERMASGGLPMVVLACVLAPVLEEMLFRGIVLRSFLRQFPRWNAIGLSAVLFGVAHMNVYQFVVGFIVGVLSGWLYERSRSLLPCIVLHATYNTALLAVDRSGDATAEPISLATWAAVTALGVVGASLLRRLLVARAPSA